MAQPLENRPGPEPASPAAFSLEGIISVVWECAVEAFVKSILVLVFGSIAIGIISGICRDMIPSRPPGFTGPAEAEVASSGTHHSWAAPFSEHRLAIIFSLIFIPTIWARLAKPEPNGEESKSQSRLQRIGRHLSEHWFGLVVGNAFGALISAVVLAFVQQWRFPGLLFRFVLGPVLDQLQHWLQQILGLGQANALQAWFHWYGDNQLKFAFWFFYLAAICDDLGIPNFKALGRWLVRRTRGRELRLRAAKS